MTQIVNQPTSFSLQATQSLCVHAFEGADNVHNDKACIRWLPM